MFGCLDHVEGICGNSHLARTEVIEEVHLLPVNDHLAPAQFDELVLGQEAEESLLTQFSRGQGQNAMHTREPGSEGQAGADVFAFEVRTISENLLGRHVPGQEFQDHAYGIAQPAHSWLAVANRWINRDAFQCVIHRALRCQTSARLTRLRNGELHRETAKQRANRIIAEELARRGWQESWLWPHPNFGLWTLTSECDPGKLASAAWLRSETTLPIKWIAARVQIGTAKPCDFRCVRGGGNSVAFPDHN